VGGIVRNESEIQRERFRRQPSLLNRIRKTREQSCGSKVSDRIRVTIVLDGN